MKKHLSIVVVLAMLISLFSGTHIIFASGNVELAYPENGEYINYANGVTVKGSMASGYEAGSAKIYIDGVLKKTLSNNITTIDEVITSDGISDLNFGKHELTLEAEYNGQKVFSTKEFILTGLYDKPISDPMKDVTITGSTTKEGSFSSKLGFAFTNNTLYNFNRDKDKNEVSFTRSSTEYSSGTQYAQAKFTFTNTYVSNNGVDHGKFILKTNLTVSTPCRINFGVYNKDASSFTNSNLIDENGKFLDGTECQSGVTYEIEAIYDWDEKNVTYKVNGKEVQSKSFSAKSQLNSIRVNCYAHNAAEGAKITFADLQLFHTSRLPLIGGLEYNLNNETTVEQNVWSDGCLNYDAQSVTVVMEKALDEIPGVLLKKSGTEVTSTVSLSSDNTKIVITPEDGFEPGFKYSIILSDVICSGTTYVKGIEESFKTQSHADVKFLINGETLHSAEQIGENDVISVEISGIDLSGGATDATYILSVRSDLELVAMTGKTLSNTPNWQSGFELILPQIDAEGQYEVYLMVIDSYQGCHSISKYMSIK